LIKEEAVLIAVTILLTILGLGTVIALTVLHPNQDNSVLVREVVGFLALVIMQFIGLMKSTANGTDIKIIKDVQDGQTTHAINQAATVASLTEQVESAKKAAEVAAETAKATAAALLKKDG
jgi:hypothetical protein